MHADRVLRSPRGHVLQHHRSNALPASPPRPPPHSHPPPTGLSPSMSGSSSSRTVLPAGRCMPTNPVDTCTRAASRGPSSRSARPSSASVPR